MIEEVSSANRIRADEEPVAQPPQATRDPADELDGGGHASTGGRNLWESFRLLPAAEKLLAGACAGLVFGWLVTARWSLLFDFGTLGGWFATFSAFGAGFTLVLLFVKLLNIPWPKKSVHTRLLIVSALLPTLGLVVELLNNFWFAVMLTGALAMAYAAGRITTRDNVLKKNVSS